MSYKGFIDLFPTRIHKFEINTELIEKSLIHTPTKRKGFSYKDVQKEPDFQDLKTEVEKHAGTIAPKSARTKKWKVVTSWLNVQPHSEKGFPFHNHVDSFISAVLYLDGTDMSIHFRDEPKQADRLDYNYSDYEILVRHTWNEDANIQVQKGDLIIFPSYLRHRPNTNLTKKDRISIAYNLMPERFINENARNPWDMELNL